MPYMATTVASETFYLLDLSCNLIIFKLEMLSVFGTNAIIRSCYEFQFFLDSALEKTPSLLQKIKIVINNQRSTYNGRMMSYF